MILLVEVTGFFSEEEIDVNWERIEVGLHPIEDFVFRKDLRLPSLLMKILALINLRTYSRIGIAVIFAA